MNKMTKVFVSDLHLGDGSRADDFHLKDEFLKFLDIIESLNYQLVVVGDLFELWQSDLDKVAFYHSEVIERLLLLAKKEKLIYLIGNHDHVPFVKYIHSAWPVKLEFKDDLMGIWAEHANQYDIFNRYRDPRMALCNKLGRAISYMTGWLERVIHPDIDEWADAILIKKGGEFLRRAAGLKNRVMPSQHEYFKRGGDLSEYERAAAELISKGNRIVIFGHTHRPLLKRLGSGIYANCGCWSGSKPKPTYIKVSMGRVELVDGISHKTIILLEV